MRMSDWSSDVCSSDLSFDAYASKVLDPDGAAPLDPCGCTVSGSYRRPQGVVMPRPIRASAAIDWLANQNPLSVVEWADPVVEAAGHPVRSVYVETLWLPTLWPTAMWLLWRMSAWLEARLAEHTSELQSLSR